MDCCKKFGAEINLSLLLSHHVVHLLPTFPPAPWGKGSENTSQSHLRGIQVSDQSYVHVFGLRGEAEQQEKTQTHQENTNSWELEPKLKSNVNVCKCVYVNPFS